jgi:RND superfamily putative drug exporter
VCAIGVFTRMGRWAFRARFAVIVGSVALMGGLGIYGLDWAKHFNQGGLYDGASQSVAGSRLADATFGRDTRADVIALYTAPPGKRLDDPDTVAAANATYAALRRQYSDKVIDVQGFWTNAVAARVAGDANRQHGFVSIGLAGATDTDRLADYRAVRSQLSVPGLRVQLTGQVPLAAELNDNLAADVRRGEAIALPLVALMLFFVFGGVVAAALPVFVGGLTIVGAQGLVKLIMRFTDVSVFASSVVTLIGLGLAIDYGLFTVSRFREELAAGRSPRDAVAITVGTAGRAIAFSATIIVICLGTLVIFPLGFLKSLAYGAICTVLLAASLSVTVLPAILGMLGNRVDALGFARLRRARTAAQIDASFWSRLATWSMRRPALLAAPIAAVLLALVVPFFGVRFGGVSEKYFAPDNPTRVAQQDFDRLFPGLRTDPVKLIVSYPANAADAAADRVLSAIVRAADRAPGLAGGFTPDQPRTDNVDEVSAGLTDTDDTRAVDATITYLRSLRPPAGVRDYVAGTPVLERDAVNSILRRLPTLLIILAAASLALMFLAFGSVVLPLKAMVVGVLSLTATLGLITFVFYDGHFGGVLNFTGGPLMFPMVIVIVALVFGLSTDYEIFLVSRMAEARGRGSSTRESVRYGIAHTGGVITAAALILIVVTGAFGRSTLAPMKYLAYGMIAALTLDVTLIRMLLAPAVMTLLGDACWWAPAWAKRLHRRIGLTESNRPSHRRRCRCRAAH